MPGWMTPQWHNSMACRVYLSATLYGIARHPHHPFEGWTEIEDVSAINVPPGGTADFSVGDGPKCPVRITYDRNGIETEQIMSAAGGYTLSIIAGADSLDNFRIRGL
jgi:hypothetical protein